MNTQLTADERERLRRWRLVLGKEADAPMASSFAVEGSDEQSGFSLSQTDAGMDAVLDDLYTQERQGGLGSSSPRSPAGLAISGPTFPRRRFVSCSGTR